MIAGLFVTYFKTYSKLTFIPLSNEHNLCGILGKNGIGKSSILEALDCFFNNKEWNLHFNAKKKGLDSSNPYIAPVFILEKAEFEGSDFKSIYEQLDKFFRGLDKSYLQNFNNSVRDIFFNFKESICNNQKYNDKFIVMLGVNYERNVFIPILSEANITLAVSDDDLKNTIEEIKSKFAYVYIPKDIDSEQFTKLETREIQLLMGESLENIIKGKITDKTIREINANLDDFIDELENQLDGYVYKTIQHKQQKVKRTDINKLIIDTYFSIRKLHKKLGSEKFIDIRQMSSGEKQQAIIDVAHSLLKNHSSDGKKLILGIDEPEASLHISSCLEQFGKLYDIARDCRQVIFTSHWYGYLPILNNANTCVVTKNSSNHLFDLINSYNYREEINHSIRNSQGVLPYDISLKSTSDFIQSILISIISDNPFNWLICEGSSEKIYFEKYFENEISNNKLRIVPVGGASKIKSIYQNFIVSYQELKDSIGYKRNPNWGRILLLSDTDKELVEYDVIDDDNVRCKRLVLSDNNVKLVNIKSLPKTPETEIEDCLDARLFIRVLNGFKSSYTELNNINLPDDCNEGISSYELNLGPKDKAELIKFFDIDNGEMKTIFATQYVKLLSENEEIYSTPQWIDELRKWFRKED